MRHIKLIAVISASLILCSCDGSEVKSALGLKKRAPDEFMVVSRPALTVPPQFVLPDPKPVNKFPDSGVREKAKETILGKKPSENTKTNLSKGSKALLDKAGADKASGNIRSVLEEDERAYSNSAAENIDEEHKKGFFGKLLDSANSAEEAPDPIVHPAREKERLKENQAQGLPANEGDIPVLEPKPESPLDKLLNAF